MAPRLLLSLIFSAVSVFPLGCRRQNRVEAGVATQTLYMSVRDDPADLDPETNISASTNIILSSLFEGLVDLRGDGKTLEPGVAERWEISPDGLKYIFHLRADARWSNGDPITANDFLLSFRRLFDPAIGAELCSYGFAVVGAQDVAEGRVKDFSTIGIEAPDERTFILHLRHPAPYLLSSLAQAPFYPVHLPSVEKLGGLHRRGAAWTRPENWVSNGPFVLKEWMGNQRVAVEKNPNFWAAAGIKLRRVEFIPIEDQPTEERAFRAGQVHATMFLPADKFPSYLQNHRDELHVAPLLRADYLTFNVSQAPFDNPLVRRAFSLAIDHKKLIAASLDGMADPLHSLTPDGAGGYTAPQLASSQYDPAEAKRLFAKAGFSNPSKFPSAELMLSGSQGYLLRAAEVIQDMWRRNLGVRITVRPTEFKTYLEAERTKHFQILIEAWLASLDDPQDFLQLGQTGNPNNDSGWSNRAYDEAFHHSEIGLSLEDRRKSFDAMEAILADEVPYAPLYSYHSVRLVHPSVQGWRDNPLLIVDWRDLSLGKVALTK